MLTYSSQNQLSLFDFHSKFGTHLSPNNRWVKLANLLDWDRLLSIYSRSMSSKKGAPSINARVVLGALFIKHIEQKDDRGTIVMIQENPYMQYFLGLSSFTTEPVFDPSLFVHLRKRLNSVSLDQMNQIVIAEALKLEQSKNNGNKKSRRKDGNGGDDTTKEQKDPSPQNPNEQSKSTQTPNIGKLQMDATVADANIQYPTDLNLLNESREKLESIIDQLCTELKINKPRTYRRLARKAYLTIAKKKNKSRNEIRKGIKQQLGYVRRNLSHIEKILDQLPQPERPIGKTNYRYFLIIQELYRQQLEMYTEQKHQVEHRIVSIHQPHIRPIVRGKEKHKVEFGPKINVSLQQGYARLNDIEFEAYNESTRMIDQIEAYKQLNGCYPELIQVDQIYLTHANRKYLKEHNIAHTGKPLGRTPKEELTPYQKRKQRKQRNERNQIEGLFGQGKRAFGLNRILAKLPQTQISWIASTILVMNILKWSKDFFVPIYKYALNVSITTQSLIINIAKLHLYFNYSYFNRRFTFYN